MTAVVDSDQWTFSSREEAEMSNFEEAAREIEEEEGEGVILVTVEIVEGAATVEEAEAVKSTGTLNVLK